MQRKLSKSFGMRYWWMKDRISQGESDLNWAPGKLNLAGYFTKHHPPWHHCKMRYKYLQKINSMQSILNTISARGCVSSPSPIRVPWNASPRGTQAALTKDPLHSGNSANRNSLPDYHNSSKLLLVTTVSP
jgi:hypothetical protein